MIRIRYFARLREDLGTGGESLDLPPDIRTVAALRDWLSRRGSPWHEALSAPAVLVAVNQETATPDSPLSDGDEIAFLPPVTGG